MLCVRISVEWVLRNNQCALAIPRRIVPQPEHNIQRIIYLQDFEISKCILHKLQNQRMYFLGRRGTRGWIGNVICQPIRYIPYCFVPHDIYIIYVRIFCILCVMGCVVLWIFRMYYVWTWREAWWCDGFVIAVGVCLPGRPGICVVRASPTTQPSAISHQYQQRKGINR